MSRELLIAGLVALALTSAIAVAFVLVRKRRGSASAAKRAAARRALAELRDVRTSDVAAQASRILRELIGARTGSTGRALSTDEAVALVAADTPEAAPEVRAVLEACDSALYAGSQLEAASTLARARALVNRLSR